MRLVKTFLLLGAIGLAGCKEDADEAANKLLVETTAVWEQYQAQAGDDPTKFEERLELLQQIEVNLGAVDV